MYPYVYVPVCIYVPSIYICPYVDTYVTIEVSFNILG